MIYSFLDLGFPKNDVRDCRLAYAVYLADFDLGVPLNPEIKNFELFVGYQWCPRFPFDFGATTPGEVPLSANLSWLLSRCLSDAD